MNPENEEQPASSAAATSTSASAPLGSKSGKLKPPSNFIGRHRLQASISHLQQQIQIIQDELDELGSMGGPSTVCNEIISGIESATDPLLPITRGPVDVNWERWFGGASSSRNQTLDLILHIFNL